MSTRTLLKKKAISSVVSQHTAKLLAGATATALVLPTGALSQQLEEVVVTAQKRESNLQDTSLSVQVLGEDALRDLNVSGFNDFVQFLPTVSYVSTRPGISQVYMRGISTGGDGNHSASSPSVGVYLDEQPITTINEILDLHMYDIARVETLAGPQGTLFGASSQAGTIRIITNKPVNDFEASYDLSLNTVEDGDEGYTAEGMINLPLTDNMALRLVGWYDKAGGYIDNVAGTIEFTNVGTIDNKHLVEKDFNDVETQGARAQLRIDLNEDWAITPGITYQKMDSNGQFWHDPDNLEDLETTEYYDTFYDEEWYQAALTVEGRIGDLDLVYAGAYLDRDRDSQYDYTGFAEYYNNYLYQYEGSYCYLYNAAGDCTDPSQYVDQDENWNRQSHELRIQEQEGRLRWIVGMFYQEQEHDFDLQWIAPSSSSEDYSLIPGGHSVWQTHQTREDKQTGVFGEVSYDLTESLTVLGGLRYYDYENSLFGFNGWIGRCTGYREDGEWINVADNDDIDEDRAEFSPPCYNTGVLDEEVSNDDVLGKVNLTYTISDDALVYFTWSEGYRPGGTNRSQDVGPYEEDFVTNWEVGTKTTWMDGRMRLNGAVYFMDWEDIQYNALDFGDLDPLTSVFNTGDAETYGLEFDMDMAVTQALTWSLSGAYTNAETVDENATLPYIPEYQFSTILRYDTQWGENNLYAQGAWSYRDEIHTDLNPVYDQVLDSYHVVNLAFGISRNNWHADLFIDNATDEIGELAPGFIYPNYYIQTDNHYDIIKPRTIGIRFGQSF
jgi:iron complex outermembrane receptor protein